MYVYRYDKAIFKKLKNYSSFFFFQTDCNGCDSMRFTEFGDKDIAFFDKNDELVFWTITHEGYADIRQGL